MTIKNLETFSGNVTMTKAGFNSLSILMSYAADREQSKGHTCIAESYRNDSDKIYYELKGLGYYGNI